MSKPELVEPGMKYFMNMALVNSRKTKFNYYNFWINIVCFIVFALGITLWLFERYKGKLSPKDFGNMLVGVATEYNDALLVIENASVGFGAIQSAIDRDYKNLY